VPTNEGIRIDLKLSHQAIAEAIGSTRVTVTRLLGDLRESDLIAIHKKKITVYNPVALSQQFT
jgi:CRP-like cAMP-binding protein